MVEAVADPGFSPGGGAPTPKIAIIFHIFAENCMKMKEFGPPGGGARPWRPPLDPPMGSVYIVALKGNAIAKRNVMSIFLFKNHLNLITKSR